MFFASVGINIQMTGMSRNLLIFSVLLLVISVISKVLGCGVGARVCGFTNRESLQVGAGMVCRGEVALIVANRGLAMGVLSSAMMTPVIITVIGGTILTPILLKIVFGKEAKVAVQDTGLVDHYEKTEQLDIVSDELLDVDQKYMNQGKEHKSGKS